MKAYTLLLMVLFVNTQSFGQKIPVLRGEIIQHDTIDPVEDRAYGVGDDGIYNIDEPIAKASSALKGFEAVHVKDFDLLAPWIEGKEGDGIGEYVELSFDLRNSGVGGNALAINSIRIINGYRKNEKVWKANGRVKKLKMYIDNKPFAYILLADTYKMQVFSFPDHWIKYGERTPIKFEILEVYAGEKYSDTAIGEIKFDGKYPGNM